MADPISSFDLRFTPDWLKESEKENRYADYEGEEQQSRRERDSRPRRGSGSDRQRRDQRSPGPRPARPGGQRSRDAAPGQKPPRSEERSRPRRDEPRPTPPEEVEPAAVQVDFLPEERAFTKVIQQIKQGHTAYPLFGLARMFLERPERHRLRLRSLDNSKMLYQLGDYGPVALEAAALDRIAFSEKRDEFYATEMVEKEPIKGNFTSVARCTLSGRVLGPTNYHTFQKTIRSLYDQRFSRRMSFEEYRRTIEITTDPTVVNQWKEEARKIMTFRTRDGDPPLTFENLSALEQHFRENYFQKAVKPCLAAEIYGDHVRHLPDRSVVAAIRKARDRENRFPAQMAGALRHGLNQAGLHVFKHKKRILYISTVRPQLFDPNQASLSPGLAAILAALRSYPRITRKQLAEKVLAKLVGEKGRDASSSEYAQAKTNLASDLLWLAKAGHVIEFSDGTLDLPLSPKAPEQKGPTEGVPATAAVATDIVASEEESDPVKAEPETLTEQAPAAEGEVDEGTFVAQTEIETAAGQAPPDQKSSEAAPNLGEVISQKSAEEPVTQPGTIPSPVVATTTEAAPTVTERTETDPPSDSPEERREWAAAGP
ncbi:MAG TPA: hypothetical protein VFO40_12930 [Chthoniobacterales bacterium]|nr:hypothetical protein [Chthoniobacterales bacterium]